MKTELINELIYKLSNIEYKQEIEKVLVSTLQNYEVIAKDTNQIIDVSDDALLSQFCAIKRSSNRTDLTIEQYITTAKQLIKFVNKPLSDITPDDIDFFLREYKVMYDNKDSTMLNKYRNLKSIFSTLYAYKKIEYNPMLLIDTPKVPKLHKEPLTLEEKERIRIACGKDYRLLAITSMLFDTGCRATELINIKMSDVNFGNKTIKIFGKGRKERVVGFGDKTALYLKVYLDNRPHISEYLFTNALAPYGKLTKASFKHLIDKIGAESGVERLHPHLFRHTTATTMSSLGVGIEEIAIYLGHENVNTTMRYVKSDIYGIINKLNNVGYVS